MKSDDYIPAQSILSMTGCPLKGVSFQYHVHTDDLAHLDAPAYIPAGSTFKGNGFLKVYGNTVLREAYIPK